MWILLWGDNTNRASGQWNREDNATTEAALKSAESKIHMGLQVQAILKPSGEEWMSAGQITAKLETRSLKGDL